VEPHVQRVSRRRFSRRDLGRPGRGRSPRRSGCSRLSSPTGSDVAFAGRVGHGPRSSPGLRERGRSCSNTLLAEKRRRPSAQVSEMARQQDLDQTEASDEIRCGALVARVQARYASRRRLGNAAQKAAGASARPARRLRPLWRRWRARSRGSDGREGARAVLRKAYGSSPRARRAADHRFFDEGVDHAPSPAGKAPRGGASGAYTCRRNTRTVL